MTTDTAGRQGARPPAPTGKARVQTPRRDARKTFSMVRAYLVLTIVAILFAAPIYYLLLGSLKPSSQVLNGFAGFLPVNLSFDNYAKVFNSLSSETTGYFVRFYLNSVVISFCVVVGGMIINSMTAYALARLEWTGKKVALLVVVLLVIVPFQAVAIPLAYLLNGQRDTLLVQIIPFIASPFSIFLFYTFFLGLPKSIEEAARLDGLGAFGVFTRIVVPMSRPVFATVAILTFLSTWGGFLWPSLVTADPDVRPLPLEIGVFSSQQPPDWGAVFAFGTMLVLPVLVLYLVFQRFFVQSIAGSAVKG